MDKEKFILATIASAITGTAIGLLFAPEKGAETRKNISEKSDEYLQELKKEIADIRRDMNKRAGATKEEIEGLGENAKQKGEEVLKEAKKMASYEEWAKDELYQRAKELNIENYSQMNKAELIEALRDH
jgi:gas vesicle protein